jgi:aryl-alcohol dehydrogenase-like predicted oxidoreductase
MNTTKIQGTNLSPSSLCMGTGDFGAGIDRPAAYALLDTFVDYGGTFIDTAKIYSDWIPGERSRSEKVIGEWLQMRKNRQNIILATKGAHFHLESPQIPRVSPAEIISDLDASLQHLQTDMIDLYWLHRDDPSRPVAEIIQTLDAQVQAGKIRYYGGSNWRQSRLKEAQEFAQANGMKGFCAVQNFWSLAKITPGGIADPTIVVMDDDLWGYHHENQLAAIPFSSQANGIFQKLAGGKKESLSPMHQRMYINPETEQRFSQMQNLSKQSGMTITQIVLGYLLSQPFPTIPIFSSRNQDQLKDTLSAANIRLTKDQLDFLLG